MAMYKGFNVRVYGVLVEDGKLLVSDEYIKEHEITKLPGGGLEFGEAQAWPKLNSYSAQQQRQYSRAIGIRLG